MLIIYRTRANSLFRVLLATHVLFYKAQTLAGTNLYLLGTSNPYILVDTAEGKDESIPVLEDALTSVAAPQDAGLPDVSDIILSHWHGDHIGGLPSVLPLLQRLWASRNPGKPFPAPRIHKHPLVRESDASSTWNKLPGVLDTLPKDLYTPTSSGAALHDLHDSQILSARDTTLHVLYTPGHTYDSIGLHIAEDNALYTADTVLGQGTSVFEDLAVYLTSLNKMLQFPGEYVHLLPSHGPVVEKGKETITMYIKHRLERETQVLNLLTKQAPGEGRANWSTWDIVKGLYASYPENIWEPAMRGILLHLAKLEGEGRVKKVGAGNHLKDAEWVALSRAPSPSL
jgi:glyoxylase-like metal-dependent hydrolase (beta-lactamase superfamily II)